MSEVEQIESRIKSLSPRDLAELRAWFADFDAQAWDRQIEAGRFAVSVSGNWRITFAFPEKHAIDVDYEDYH